ncbi:MAG: acetyltransferase [Hyphomicrobiales bacterium]|nr:acetyltransferase [Hyphomicrobiales bacterium]
MRFHNLWPRVVDRLATLRLKIRGVAIADKIVAIGKWPNVTNLGSITLGSGVKFRGVSKSVRLKANPDSEISIGDRTFLNDGVVIVSSVSISIGRHCLIGDRVEIFDTNYHEIEQGSDVVTAPIKIGNNVWIGREVLLLPGVEIGDHSVIGARSVVTKSIPARVVAAGIPAKPIRQIAAADDYIRR